ncbi:MAG: hypothetical protein H6673_09435 [Anaerolineales bacterium]|nr:hypothetical protein [Anaerolineales bacterium]
MRAIRKQLQKLPPPMRTMVELLPLVIALSAFLNLPRVGRDAVNSVSLAEFLESANWLSIAAFGGIVLVGATGLAWLVFLFSQATWDDPRDALYENMELESQEIDGNEEQALLTGDS